MSAQLVGKRLKPLTMGMVLLSTQTIPHLVPSTADTCYHVTPECLWVRVYDNIKAHYFKAGLNLRQAANIASSLGKGETNNFEHIHICG